MLFNSYGFMIFFPIVLVIYFIIPKKFRYIWLLITSYYFYMGWNPKYAVLIAITTLTTYISGRIMGDVDKITDAEGSESMIKNKKWVVAATFILNIGILIFFKYFDFVLQNVNHILSAAGISVVERTFDIVLPVGISFYTFQALGYTMDVYRGKVSAEKNFLRYALFVSFFPNLISGPIERSGNLLAQINCVEEIRLPDGKRIANGAILMLYGYFLKMVLADRLVIVVDQVFDQYWMYGSVELVLAAVLFAIQLYCDFSSYSLIAIGAAKVMGFQLLDNFDAPYFSRSIKEFWRRWHISLSTWFRDYLYIPLGGSRCSQIKKYRNLMITFLVSGLWHGSSWSFFVWGGAARSLSGDRGFIASC